MITLLLAFLCGISGDGGGAAFFVFLHAKTGRVSVVYRRADGGHALIDPVVPRQAARGGVSR